MAPCKLGKWGTFLDVMAVATVLKRPLFSLYPLFESNERIRPLLNGLSQPCITTEKDSATFYIVWSRESFDNRPGMVFLPNHFVPVTSHLSNTQPSMTVNKDKPSLQIKASPASGKQKGISEFFQPAKHATKRSPVQAVLTSASENVSVPSEKVPKQSVVTIRKFQDSWKVEFPWVIYDTGSNTMFCDFCQKAGAKIADKTDFVSGSKTFKETLKKHGESHSHLRAHDFVINEQRPVTQGPLFKGLKKAAEKVEEQAFN